MEPEKTAEMPAPALQQPENSRMAFVVGAIALSGLVAMSFIAFSTASQHISALRATAAAAASQKVPFEFKGVAKSVYVYDLSEKRVLFEKNSDVQLPLASITKVPLVLVISKVLAPEDTVIVSREAVARGEGGGLGTGDTWRVQDLIDFTLAASSNAGAEVLAEAADAALRAKYPEIPESEAAAVWRMNEHAHALGLSRTYFLNPSGIDLSSTQAASMSTAREVAMMMREAAKTPELFSGTTKFDPELGPLNGTVKKIHNTNEALPDIPGLIIGKTGFTDLAGGNLAVVFDTGLGRLVVAVVMGSTSEGRFEDMKQIVEALREQASNL